MASAAPIVVLSKGPSSASYPVGRPVPPGMITLKTSDQITILDEQGTRVLVGPGEFTIGAENQARRSSLIDILTKNNEGPRVRTGAASRAAKSREPLPDGQYVPAIEVARGGTVCLVAPRRTIILVDPSGTLKSVQVEGPFPPQTLAIPEYLIEWTLPKDSTPDKVEIRSTSGISRINFKYIDKIALRSDLERAGCIE
jgi:hypothetical protein